MRFAVSTGLLQSASSPRQYLSDTSSQMPELINFIPDCFTPEEEINDNGAQFFIGVIMLLNHWGDSHFSTLCCASLTFLISTEIA
jgi:hypothetical protein